MGLKYKIDVIKALKDKGYTSYTIRQDKLLSESTLTKLRNKEGISWENIERICQLLEIQPADLMEYISDKK